MGPEGIVRLVLISDGRAFSPGIGADDKTGWIASQSLLRALYHRWRVVRGLAWVCPGDREGGRDLQRPAEVAGVAGFVWFVWFVWFVCFGVML